MEQQVPTYQIQDDFSHRVSVTVGVVIPLIQASVTGFLIAIAAGIILTLLEFSPWKGAALAWAISATVMWFRLLGRWVRVVHAVEERAQIDLDRDGYIGEPGSVPVEEMRIVVSTDDFRVTQRDTFPATPQKMILLAQRLLKGEAFTERSFSGRGEPFSQQQVVEVRAIFVKHGWARWINPDHHQQGVYITHLGEQVLRKMAVGDFEFRPPPGVLDDEDGDYGE